MVKKRKLYGASSEVLDQMVMDQFTHLFNEAECQDAAGQEPVAQGEKEHRMRRRSSSALDVIPEGTPVEVVEHRLPEEWQFCICFCHCTYCRAEICDVFSFIPTGKGI